MMVQARVGRSPAELSTSLTLTVLVRNALRTTHSHTATQRCVTLSASPEPIQNCQQAYHIIEIIRLDSYNIL